MSTIFSARTRASTWRQLWVWLAEAEKELGLPISEEALEQMRANIEFTDEDFKVAAEEVSVWFSSLLFHMPKRMAYEISVVQFSSMLFKDWISRGRGANQRLGVAEIGYSEKSSPVEFSPRNLGWGQGLGIWDFICAVYLSMS